LPRGSWQPLSCPTNLLSSVEDDRPPYLLDSKWGESPGALWGPEPLLACLVQLSQWQEGCVGHSPQAGWREHGRAEKQGTSVSVKVCLALEKAGEAVLKSSSGVFPL